MMTLVSKRMIFRTAGPWLLALLLLSKMVSAATLQVTQTDKLTAVDALAGDRFGTAVAQMGDLLVVGAPGVEGAGPAAGSVYIFQRNIGGAELWAMQTELNIASLRAGDSFGAAVAMHHNQLAVGAPGDDDQGNNSGAVYIFAMVDGDARRWALQQKLTVPDARDGHQFGQVLALEGDRLVVAAPFADDARGTVYSFVRSTDDSAQWQLQAQLQGDTTGERFGTDLALYHSLLAVSAPLAKEGQAVMGRVNVYRQDGTSPEGWHMLSTLWGDQASAGFGSAIALNSHWLGVGTAWVEDSRGAVQLFRVEPTRGVWQQAATLTAPSPGAGQRFGDQLAISGDTLLVGASQNDAGGSNVGAVYVFDRDANNPSGWTLSTAMRADDSVSGDQFGGILSFDGTTIVVGVPNDSDVGVESGSAYTFLRGGSRWRQTDKLISTSPRANEQFGVAVALSDETLLVGAHLDAERGVDAGAVHVFERGFNQGSRWLARRKLLASSTDDLDRFGQAVAISGNTLAIGATGDEYRGGDTGAAFVFHQDWQAPSGWREVQPLHASDADPGDSFGNALAMDQDLLLVGAFANDGPGSSAGAAYLYRHQPGADPAWQLLLKLQPEDAAATQQFGVSVALQDDLAVVGAHFDDHAGSFSGSAYIFQRDPQQPEYWVQIAKLTADDAAANDQFGYAVALSNHLIAVGAPGKAVAGPRAGAVYLFSRGERPGQWLQWYKVQAPDGRAEDQFGFSVDLSQHWLMVGARRHDGAGEDTGAVYVYGRNHGGTDRWGALQKLIPSDARPGMRFGESVSVYNNTLVVGAPSDNHSGAQAGSVYLFGLGR